MSTPPTGGFRNPSSRQKRFLYEHISERILELIQSSALRVGERVPSVRQLSERFGVSVNTVIQSYRQLEAEGYLEARPQSGFYVRAIELDGAPLAGYDRFPLLPVELSLSEQVFRYMSSHTKRHVADLGIALPSHRLMPISRMHRTLTELLREDPVAAWDYLPINGHRALLQQLARRTLTYEVPVAPEDVVITNGCTEALTLSVRAVSRPGEAIAVESPTYYNTLLMLEAHDRRVVAIPTHPTEGICLDSLEKVFERRSVAACLFSANAQNPLGFTLSRAAKQRIVELSARYGIPLIENDIWGDTVYDASQAVPAKAFDRQGLVLYCNSFSKSLAPGLRLGWSMPGRFRRRVQELKQLTTITPASISQLVVGQLLENGSFDLHLRELRKHLQQQVMETIAEIHRSFPAGTHVTRPSGGCVLWVQLPFAADSQKLFELARDADIHIFPGTVFSAQDDYRNYIRINAGNPLSPAIRQAIRSLGQLVRSMASSSPDS
jgi:DNA-binding transcriptional MocR family regulator